MTLQDIGDIVHEDGGTLWRRKPRATSSFEEFLHSREHWLELFQETDWNPWRKEELAPQMGRADQVGEEWERAEPDFRPLTERQVSARIAAIRRRVRVEGDKDEARWEQDEARYDADREMARYALLEHEAIQANLERELADHRSGGLFPAMSGDRRTKEILELEAKREQSAAELQRLSIIVGDREEVVDSDGKLPADRRRWNVIWYRHLRIEWVGELNELIAAQQVKIAGTKDRKEKSTLRVHLGSDQRRMEALLAIPRLEAEQMCADCYTPAFQHTSGGDIYETRPCPNWPMHAARMERMRETLRSVAERKSPTVLEPPKPQPLATQPGELPIAQVIERLSELQAEHPDAVVRKGRSSRWEILPGDEPER